MSLWVIKTAGRNDATVAKAIYTSLAGMGISYPQMVCVMRWMLQGYMPMRQAARSEQRKLQTFLFPDMHQSTIAPSLGQA